jgi:hypothetical protein
LLRQAAARTPNHIQIEQIYNSKDHGLAPSEINRYVIKLLENARFDTVRWNRPSPSPGPIPPEECPDSSHSSSSDEESSVRRNPERMTAMERVKNWQKKRNKDWKDFDLTG